jgi:hypothetical protein
MKDHDEEVAELNALVREAHMAIKDLNTLLKKVEKATVDLEGRAQQAIDTSIDQAVERGLQEYNRSVMQAIENATQAVYARFDTIRDTLLGATKTMRRMGYSSIEDMAEETGRTAANAEKNRIL